MKWLKNLFKKKETKLEDAASELLELLREEKAIRMELAKSQGKIDALQKEEMQKHIKEKKSQEIENRKNAISILQSMLPYFTMLEESVSEVNKSEIRTVLVKKKTKLNALGYDVDLIRSSVQRLLRDMGGRGR
jgi:hypothetical protein